MMRLPRSDSEELKKYELFRLFLDVEHPLSSFSLKIFKMSPNANPIKPPKVKMKYVPKGSFETFNTISRLS